MNKNVLITGVAGFIASQVAVYLVNNYPEYNFIGIDKLSYCSNVKNFENIIEKPNFNFIKADITDIDHIHNIFNLHKVNIIMHFAAYTHVDNSFGNSIEFTKNNILGTHVLLEVSRILGIEKFIHVSTDEVYGNKDILSNETSVLDPTNPYAATKCGAEFLVKSYYHSFKLPIIITRGNNVYGPFQYPEKVIPKFITNLINGKKCPIQGSGEQKRSFMYIKDVCRAFEIILNKGKVGEIYNLGIEKEYSVLEILEYLVYIIYSEKDYFNYLEYTKDRNFNDQRYFISSKKLQKLGWEPEMDIFNGLEKTVSWYKKNKNWWKNEI